MIIRPIRIASLILAVCGTLRLEAQQATTPQPAVTPPAATAPARGVELDRLVAVVNDDVILESDVDEERRLGAFQPFRDTRRSSSRDQMIERLIDRDLILQQFKIQAEGKVTEAQVDEQLTALRKDSPACKAYQCETDAGWQRFVNDQGFSLDELKRRWRDRMEVLLFIEVRFRSGIQISDDEIREYYEKTLLPQYASQKAVAPKLDLISHRIQEILLQQQVGSLLRDWLKTLRAQGTVRTIQLSEEMP
jgi:peptidyl-prolyl cis-trans isomerase SurA